MKDFRYHFIDYTDLEQYKKGEKALYKRSCIITFDDGYEGVYKNAYPIAKNNNIPFTIFVIIDNMGQKNVINWNQAREMKESKLVTIASHSMSHKDFSTLDITEAVEDVMKSYEKIEEKIGKENLKIFTYPYGLYKENQIIELSKKGYIQNLTDNKINKSDNLDMSGLHRCYSLNDSVFKILTKIIYRSIRYN